ncbi:MAG: glutathione S-transferase [Deltaproteobacteria bacterium]|nr:glutathione S-transferase [Deltaproteobacteria bacterium]
MGRHQRGTLYGVSLSPFVRKVRAALALKEIQYELVNVMPGAMEPEFLAKSPLSKIPVWEEGDGFSLPDSSVICAYLERIQPEPALYPEDPRAMATALFWEEYSDTRVVDSGTPIFFQRVVRAHIFKQSAEEEIVRRHLEDLLPPVLDQIEALFIGRDGADGGEITIGTLSMWSPHVNLLHAGVSIDSKRWPGLAAFLARMNEHPLLAAILEEERAALASF